MKISKFLAKFASMLEVNVILSLPLNINVKNDLNFYDYKSNQQKEISENFKKVITKKFNFRNISYRLQKSRNDERF